MVFLPIFLFAAYANLILAIRGLVLKGRDGFLAQVHFLCCLVGAFGILFGFELVPDPRKGIVGNAYNWCVVAFFVFGLMTVLLFGRRLCQVSRQSAEPDALSLRFGTTLLAVLAGAYICGTVVDHWLFFRDFSSSGIAEPSFLGRDVKCSSPVLVRLDGDRALYRCPTLVEFGRDYGQPFVPWPAYTQGEIDGRLLRQQLGGASGQLEAGQSGAVLQLPASEIRVVPQQ
jgi:hypothetical protein